MRVRHHRHMSNNDSPPSPWHEDDEHARKNQQADPAEHERMMAESSRQEAERLRISGEEVRELSERHRQELESVRQESEAQRNSAEQARQEAEANRAATMDSVAATAEALSANFAQMQFLLNAHKVFRELEGKRTDEDR